MKLKIFTSESKEKLYYLCLVSIQGSDDVKSLPHKECVIITEINYFKIYYCESTEKNKLLGKSNQNMYFISNDLHLTA